jgi:hypothetical protein
MQRARFLVLAVSVVATAAAAVAATPPVAVTYFGTASLPYKCHAAPWTGQVDVDALVGRSGTQRTIAADIFAKGFQSGQCPPPIYGLRGGLSPTSSPLISAARAELSLERCQLGPNVSTDLEPFHAELRPDDSPDEVIGSLSNDGRWTTLVLEGAVHLWNLETGAHTVEHGCGFDSWTLTALTRSRKPKPPPPGEWDELPDLPRGPRVKGQASGGKSGEEAAAGGASTPPLLVAVQPCPAATLCLARPGSSRADLLVRNVEQFDFTQALAFVTLGTDEIEVWRRLEGQVDAEAVSWLFPALSGKTTANTGLLDTWDRSEGDFPLRASYRQAAAQALAVTGDDGEPPSLAAAAAAPKPPYATWVTSPLIPGFRFQVRFGAWLEQAGSAPGVGSTKCLAQAACLGRTAGAPAALFIRLLPGKKGARLPILAKFADGPVEVWIEQTARKRVRYYRLGATIPGLVGLDGLLDRTGFPK